MPERWIHALLLVFALGWTTQASAAPTLMRYPTSSAQAIAFVAHGELWIAPREGGNARLLVGGEGDILRPRFSPNGQWIAFTRRAQGGQDVFAAPSAGGKPRRLTHDARPDAGDNLVAGWTPDSRRILFLSTRMSVATRQVQAFSVSVSGGLAQRLPLDQSGPLDISPIDGRIAYTRTFTDLAMRKRYVGGMAEDIFVYDPKSRKLDRITDWKGTDTAPMWYGRRLYFLSDRGAGFRLNLWRYDPGTGRFTQITHFNDYDIGSPSLGGGRIVFQQAGHLWALDLPQERLHVLHVSVADDGTRTAPRIFAAGFQARGTDVTGAVDYALSPAGAVALVAAHGDIFRVNADDGVTRNLTATPGRDEDHPAVSPDGRLLAYVTENDQAQQIAVRPVAGGPEHRLTRFTGTVLYTPVFSPDGHDLAVPDAEHRLWLVRLDGSHPVRVARDPLAEIRDPAFSPDGRWLAYSTTRPNGLTALHLYRLADGRDVIVSGDLDGDRLPAFSSDGKRLFFVSQRHGFTVTGDRGDEASIATIRSDGIYAASLANGIDGLMQRATALPVTPGRITALATRGDSLFYESRPPAWVGGDLPGSTSELHRIGPTGADGIVLGDFDDEAVSADGLHVLFRRKGAWRVLEIGGTEQALDLSRVRLTVDPRAEWREMFYHAWRLDRDLFFSRVMNGTGWAQVRHAYEKFLPLLGSRDDARYLIGQMQGELATSHAFMGGQDADQPGPAVTTPRLGADLVLDPASGRYRFGHVYTGDPTRERFRAPLNDPATGVAVKQGDYLLAIDGVELRTPTDPDQLLIGKHGGVVLTVAASADGARHDVRVSPLTSDLDLRQHDWVAANKARVNRLSGRRVGYVFLGDFAAAGSQDLARQLQGQIGKQGLVIDIRWNRGGFLSQAVLELLRRAHVGAFVNREGAVSPLPLVAPPKAMAVIINAGTASDGDQFAYYFRTFGLGPVVGQRSWGGVQGIRGPWPLMDGTTLTIPKDSLAATDGHWIIENAGVTPDIPMDPSPDEVVTGKDRMLETAVAAVLKEIRQHPPRPLRAPDPLPAYPPNGNVPGARFAPGTRDQEQPR